MLRNADWGGGMSNFSRKKCYEGVRFNVISVMKGGGGCGGPISRKNALRNT